MAEAMVILFRVRLSDEINPPKRRVTSPLKLWESEPQSREGKRRDSENFSAFSAGAHITT